MLEFCGHIPLFCFVVYCCLYFVSGFDDVLYYRWCDVHECRLHSGVLFDWGWLF